MAIILILAPSTAHLSEVNSSKIQDVRLAKQITALEQELELTRKALAVAQDEAKRRSMLRLRLRHQFKPRSVT